MNKPNTQNKIIIVCGYCATGKSTFSRSLSKRIQIPCFNKDTIKEAIGEGFGSKNKEIHQKNSAVTFKLMLHIAEQLLQAKTPCILESNLKLSESEQLKKLLNEYNCECLTFLFEGDADVLYERYIERALSGNRHWVHTTEGEDKEMFINSHLQSGVGKVQLGNTIHINATSFSAIDYENLFSMAKKFIQAN